MRKFSIILLVLINTTFFAQTAAPQLINYQGVARDASGNPIIGPIGVRFHIHQSTPTGSIVFTEVHSPTTNAYGIFNVKIGSNNPSQFTSITWGTDDYFLEVQMDPTGATSYSSIGNQQLVSVPYALYAKNAGNSASYNAGSNVTFTGPANNPTINSNPNLSLSGNVLSISGSGSPVTLPSYLAGSNVTLTPSGSNYIINAAGAATSTVLPYSLTVNSPHNVTAGPSASLTIVAPNISVTGGGATVTGNVLPNYSINIPTVVVTPTTGGLIFTQNGNTSTVAVGGNGQWTNTGPIVHLVTGSNNVGIGTTNSTAKLTVTTNIAIDAILAQSAGANGILAQSVSSGTADAGVYGTNNGAGFGLRGETISTNTNVAAVLGVNNGTGGGNGIIGITNSSNPSSNGVYGRNNNVGAGVSGENLQGTSSIAAHGVKGVTNSTGAQAAGVFGENKNIGAGVYGINNYTLSANSNAHGVYGKTSNSDVAAAGVYGINSGIGNGVFGQTGSAATNAYGVYGKSVGSGDGVHGETSSPNVTVAGVSGLNTGTGVALKGSLPSASVAGSSNVAMLLENGHIKATSTANAISSFSVSFSLSATHNIVPNAGNNDVRGVVTYTTNQTAPAPAGTYVNINTTFSKIYSSPPVVVISCMNANLQGWELQLAQINSSFFAVRAVNNSGGPASPPANITFSYIVIE
ncbi:MAG: hypothetical protein JNJ41_03165 [Bacteroidia bacterium]|nr:hypothetical protein [Bacteroidia bacterium]